MTNIHKLLSLRNRVSVVTGGGAGLGLQMATGLAEAGSNIVICSRKVEKCEIAAQELLKLGVKVMAMKCDASKEDDIEKLKDAVIDKFKCVDILVNNAGRAWFAPPEETPIDKWKYVMELNVSGTFLCSQIFGREMIKRKSGKIINIASVSGLRGKDPKIHNSLSYNTSKGAVVNMTRDLAVKWAQYNICVNAIAPGFFLASRNQERFEERKEQILNEIPMRRPGGSNDLKGPVVFLASDASNFVTGTILSVDGGVTAW